MTDPPILHAIGGQSVVGLDIPTRVVHVNEELHGEMYIRRDFLKSLVREVLEERDAQVSVESSVPREVTRLKCPRCGGPRSIFIPGECPDLSLSVVRMDGALVALVTAPPDAVRLRCRECGQSDDRVLCPDCKEVDQ